METLTGAVDPTPPSNDCDLILILDFGSQYTLLLTRRLRSLSLPPLPLHLLSSIASHNPCGIILSGGLYSVHAMGYPSLPDGFFAYVRSNGIHVLSICYRLQLLVQELGGATKVDDAREYGRMEIFVEREGGLFGADGEQQTVWMSHGDEVAHLPHGFHVAPRSGRGAVAAIEWRERRLYGLQYHPEVTHSPKGMETLSRFLFNICGVTTNWKMQDLIQEQIKVITDMVGPEDHVICAFSGGIASMWQQPLFTRQLEIGFTAFSLKMVY